MNFTSQICTTKEQSGRLLALGLNRETADMCWFNDMQKPFCAPYKCFAEKAQDMKWVILPAWSLHRLIEMMPTYIGVVSEDWTLNILQGKLIAYTNDERNDFLFAQGAISLYDSIIAAIEWHIQTGHFNKEYLSEV